MYIDITATTAIVEQFLTDIKFLHDNERVHAIEKPGEGNMNVVLRVQTNKRSFIVKQSRPFVQKYQDIPAPLDRIDVEHQFYTTVINDIIQPHIPKVLGYYEKENTLLLEDLGDCEDMSYIYQSRTIPYSQVVTLVDILHTIHTSNVAQSYPENTSLRLLNHQHIFILPFLTDTDFSLDSIQDGLQTLSLPYKNDELLKKEILNVGTRYLSEGNTLLHGDYYPGSWMTRDDHIYVIDPEFSFKGFAEFDLGVLVAHMMMTTMQSDCLLQVIERYKSPVDKKLLSQMAGIEIMRRLIGLAQLPLQRSLEEKETLLKMAYRLIL